MKRRKWSSDQKLKIVLEGLSGQIEIGKLCNKLRYIPTFNRWYYWSIIDRDYY